MNPNMRKPWDIRLTDEQMKMIVEMSKRKSNRYKPNKKQKG